MSWLDSVRTVTPEYVIFARLLLAAVLGGVIGIDRELKRRPAGLRTHMLVSMGAALFTVVTFELLAGLPSHLTGADPLRVVGAVTSGVGFLAAGAIIQSRGTVHGLTTGAGLWLAAALGVACGAGDYLIAVMAAFLTVVVLAAFKPITRWLAGGDSNEREDKYERDDNRE